MALRKREGALTSKEKRIVKGLLNKGGRNQDIQALLNIGRDATVNSARVTEVKNNDQQRPASDDEISFFEIRKESYDQQTGLNRVDDERLIRAREAIFLPFKYTTAARLILNLRYLQYWQISLGHTCYTSFTTVKGYQLLKVVVEVCF